MFRFGFPNIHKMYTERDYDGLSRCLLHRDRLVQLEAAAALAELNDGRGWRLLMDLVRDPKDSAIQAAAAEALGQLGHPRAVEALKQALPTARAEAYQAIQEALFLLGETPSTQVSQPAEDYRRQQQDIEGKSVLSGLFGAMVNGIGNDEPPLLPNTEMGVHSPEDHLNRAVQLREAELQERGLIECDLGLWQRGDWAYAWYVRGVLLEDLEREREALAAYERALHFDRHLPEAREAFKDLEAQIGEPEVWVDALLSDLVAADWRRRRDAVFLLGEGLPGYSAAQRDNLAAALLPLLEDEEREVRHAVIGALAHLGAKAGEPAVGALLAQRETSLLLRVAVLRTLGELGAVDALFVRLRLEMQELQERNPVFSLEKDPLLEFEFPILAETGILSFEAGGAMDELIALAEGNVWEEAASDESSDEEEDEDLDEVEPVEGAIDSYVDEASEMAAYALERFTHRHLADLTAVQLQRLAQLPDLTLLGLAEDAESLTVIHDFSALRRLAVEEQQRRENYEMGRSS